MSHDDVAPKAGPHIDQVNAAATRVPIDSLAGWAAKTRSFGGVCGGGGQVGTLGACATVFIGHRHSQPAPPPTLLSPFLPRPSRTDSDPFQGERDRREVDSVGSVEPVPLLVPFFPAFAGGFAGPEGRGQEKKSSDPLQIASPMTHAIPPPLGTSSSHHQEETAVWLRGWLESVPGSFSTEANDRRRHHHRCCCCCRIDVTAGIGSHASP